LIVQKIQIKVKARSRYKNIFSISYLEYFKVYTKVIEKENHSESVDFTLRFKPIDKAKKKNVSHDLIGKND